MRQATMALLAVALAAVGCREQPQQQSGTRLSTEWPGWEGATTIDPAGDGQKLQGKWRLEPRREEGAAEWPEAYLVFEGDTATFEFPSLGDEGKTREPGQKPYLNKYRFVLNSSLDPRVIRLVHRLGEGKPMVGHQRPSSTWYKLDGDTLTKWDHLLGDGHVKVSYRRVRE